MITYQNKRPWWHSFDDLVVDHYNFVQLENLFVKILFILLDKINNNPEKNVPKRYKNYSYLSKSPRNFLEENILSGSSEPLEYFFGLIVVGRGNDFLCSRSSLSF